MVVTPTQTHATGIWTLSKEHERLMNLAQRKMIRFFVQTKRRYKEKTKEDKIDEAPEKYEEQPNASGENCITDEETEEGSKTNSDCDQDSDVSLRKKEKAIV